MRRTRLKHWKERRNDKTRTRVVPDLVGTRKRDNRVCTSILRDTKTPPRDDKTSDRTDDMQARQVRPERRCGWHIWQDRMDPCVTEQSRGRWEHGMKARGDVL